MTESTADLTDARSRGTRKPDSGLQPASRPACQVCTIATGFYAQIGELRTIGRRIMER